MWSGTNRTLLGLTNLFCKIRKFSFMSDAFRCETAWNDRLKSPLLQKVNLDNMFYEIDNKYNTSKSISAVDVDIFVNAVSSSSHIDEMEDIVHRLRMSSETTNIFPSTHHAFIRVFLTHGSPNELMRILNDRLNYGIFPDNFCYILLMDYYIGKEDYRDAAKVACLQMLQEDFSNDLLKYLSLYSCTKYLLNPIEWEEHQEVSEEQNDGEEIKVRVKYIRNPYFDNHFDLREPNSLIGKTFSMIGENIDSSIKKDVMLIGHCLLGEWTEAKTFINDALKNKKLFTETTLDIVERLFTNQSDEEGKDSSCQEVKNGVSILKSGSSVTDINLLNFLETKVKKEAILGENFALEQVKLYEEWENHRDTYLQEEIEKLNKADKLGEIERKKIELHKREEELYFFDHENESDLKIEKNRRFYQPRWQGKKKKKPSYGMEYIPPEITKQKRST